MARILIVDDEAGYRSTLQAILTAESYEVETAENGEDAIEASQRFCPDVLIADWKLKDRLSGLEVARALRASNPRLATIIITGYSVEQLKAEARDMEDMRVLEKPFGADDLLGMIRELSGTQGVRR